MGGPTGGCHVHGRAMDLHKVQHLYPPLPIHIQRGVAARSRGPGNTRTKGQAHSVSVQLPGTDAAHTPRLPVVGNARDSSHHARHMWSQDPSPWGAEAGAGAATRRALERPLQEAARHGQHLLFQCYHLSTHRDSGGRGGRQHRPSGDTSLHDSPASWRRGGGPLVIQEGSLKLEISLTSFDRVFA